jgi:NADH-quinone oxidoreductase subunit E
MLSPEEKHEIEKEAAHYTDRKAVCVEALKILQKRRGWVSDESIREIAAMLGMTADELDSVATFYNLIFRKPVGRHVILVCDSVSCWVRGYTSVREHLRAKLGVNLGGTTSDERFTLLPIVCLGACDVAPAMLIDGDLHGNLDASAIDQILERYK